MRHLQVGSHNYLLRFSSFQTLNSLILHTDVEATGIRWLGYTFRLICFKGGQVRSCMKLLIHS